MIYSSEVPDAKKAKGDDEEEEEEYNLADIAEGSVTSVRIRGARNHLNGLTLRISILPQP